MNTEHLIPRAAGACALAACCAFSAATLLGCSSDAGQGTAQPAVQAQTAEEPQQESITAHGSTYEKAETVSVTTTLSGGTTAVAVDEWLKNPSGLDVIDDVSTLQQIAANDKAITFTQEGEKLTWQANGQDVHYSGITDKELPFGIEYTYKLDGNEVDPSALKNVTGHLEVAIEYRNNTSGTVSAGSSTHSVKQPYAMASLVSFDAEHAKNVKVDNGQVMDQEGSFIAAGIAMPGLADSLGLADTVDLPESVTIEADVTGFDMPSITTMASNQVLGMMDKSSTNDIDSSVNDLFSQVDSIKQATEQLSQGASAIDQALSTINVGQGKLNEAFPNATDGLGKLSAAAEGVTQLTDGANQALKADTAAQGQIGEQITSLKNQIDALKAVSTDGMDDAQKEALARSIADLEQAASQLEQALAASQQATGTASAMLTKASEASSQVSDGLISVTEGLKQIQSGYEQLAQATGTVSQAASQLSQGTAQMSQSVQQAIDQARGSINEKIDLISALSDYAEQQGAFCGNASTMPASTTFVVTAKADA